MSSRIQQKRILLAMGSRYNERVHQGVAQYAGMHRWHLTNVFGTEPHLIDDRECDGIIAVLTKDDMLSQAAIKKNKPIVDLSITRNKLQVPHLTSTNLEMGQDAAHHFLDHKFRNFAWYSHRNSAAACERRKGFSKELLKEGYSCDELIVTRHFPEGIPPWKVLSQWIEARLLKVPHPVAIYAYNDVQAVDILDTCVAAGLQVPFEVAVLGTDNHPLICPTATVPLSSINHDLEAMGYRAAEELSKILNGAPIKRKIIRIPHRGITIRQSTDVFAVNEECLRRALRFLNENLQRNIGVTEIVEAANVPRRTLERHFQSTFKQSIHEELTRLRLNQVCRLLRETTFSIADIAALSGFNTPEYLHRIFLQKTGETPRKYRLSHRTEEALSRA